jgi:3-carboxy-cis,cis-muconate cycloisomerase
MRRNLEAEGGSIMAEAYMMRLAPSMGRGRAHDLVYRAASEARQKGVRLEEALRALLPDGAFDDLNEGRPLAYESYVGHPDAVCDSALELWQQRLATEEKRL